MLIPRQMRKTICNESFDLVRYGEVIVFAGQSQGSLRITAANVDKEGGDLLEKKRVAPCFPQYARGQPGAVAELWIQIYQQLRSVFVRQGR